MANALLPPPRCRRRELGDLALVAAGAIPGALLRRWLPDLLLANLLGCLLLGLLVGAAGARPRLLLWGGIGFCGSLTSFSSWILALTALPVASPAVVGAVLVPLVGGMAAFFAGRALGRLLARIVRRGGRRDSGPRFRR
ncbi:MAG: CrcB family protein [Synechococcaceae cyanobacterium]|nr:CrcB family protein [Synechococcaceae cyanobacterium]